MFQSRADAFLYIIPFGLGAHDPKWGYQAYRTVQVHVLVQVPTRTRTRRTNDSTIQIREHSNLLLVHVVCCYQLSSSRGNMLV